jgi:hypothetical protein
MKSRIRPAGQLAMSMVCPMKRRYGGQFCRAKRNGLQDDGRKETHEESLSHDSVDLGVCFDGDPETSQEQDRFAIDENLLLAVGLSDIVKLETLGDGRPLSA